MHLKAIVFSLLFLISFSVWSQTIEERVLALKQRQDQLENLIKVKMDLRAADLHKMNELQERKKIVFDQNFVIQPNPAPQNTTHALESVRLILEEVSKEVELGHRVHKERIDNYVEFKTEMIKEKVKPDLIEKQDEVAKERLQIKGQGNWLLEQGKKAPTKK